MRRNVLAFVVTLVLGVSGVATAAVFAGTGSPSGGPPGRSDQAEANESDAGVHGGPIERFHDAGSCDLTAVGSLPGNWTHGDHAEAPRRRRQPGLDPPAAWSDCGKPMVAVGHGGGPLDHALEHVAAGQGEHGHGRRLGLDTVGSQPLLPRLNGCADAPSARAARSRSGNPSAIAVDSRDGVSDDGYGLADPERPRASPPPGFERSPLRRRSPTALSRGARQAATDDLRCSCAVVWVVTCIRPTSSTYASKPNRIASLYLAHACSRVSYVKRRTYRAVGALEGVDDLHHVHDLHLVLVSRVSGSGWTQRLR